LIRNKGLVPNAIKLVQILIRGGLALLIAAGLVGQAVRDRSVLWALLMYLPLLPLGVVALVASLAWRKGRWRGVRGGLTLLSVVALIVGSLPLIGFGANERRVDLHDVVVLHWNVKWGGGLWPTPSSWSAQRTTICRRSPDIVVLSEAPNDAWLTELAEDLGPDVSYVRVRHHQGSSHAYRLVVFARRPIRLEGLVPLPGGTAMAVSAGPLRLFVVDGVSDPFRSRRPFLDAIATSCRDAAKAGRQFDIVAGDFNTPSRSLWFQGLAEQGYHLASRSWNGWRATFPAWVPLYDIDHIWVAPHWRVTACNLFFGPASDHRGQVVRVRSGS
jgi:endonuclease/exonuclease/phosphatase family metal-dependent hydrolase